MRWIVQYHKTDVEYFVLSLPDGLLARYLRLVDAIAEFGPHLGMPHTRALGDGMFELRVKGREGIARIFFCNIPNRRVVMLHGFIKKSEKIPTRELRVARSRLAEALQS